ncbi:hypothetical protein [Nodularia chucula]|uniref:hypothetical protein n=1 Tax=Nodularia chucula TaxID=3093667 RepID=UPI0039C6D9E8
MSRLLIKIIGLGLLILGIYFFAQNVIIFNRYYGFYYQFRANLSSLAIISGIFSLFFFRRETGNLGWFLLAAGLVLVILSGRIYLRPMSLWNLLMALGSVVFGYQLLNTGKVRF